VTIRWVTDGTALWGLSSAQLIPQCLDLFSGGLATTVEVRNELARHVSRQAFLADAIAAIDSGAVGLTALDLKELQFFAKLKTLWQITGSTSKNVGEATVVSLAVERGLGAILDDGQPRTFLEMNYARVPLLDTPGIVLHLVDRGVLDMHQGWDALCRMRDEGGFSHRIARRPKSDWMRRRDYPILTPLNAP